MKIARSVLPVLVAVVMASAALPAQEKQPLSPPGEASVKFDDGKTVTIKYSRPTRGRRSSATWSLTARNGGPAPMPQPASRPMPLLISAAPRSLPATTRSTPCRARNRGSSL